MSFTINEKITTTLTYQEICSLSVACFIYQELYSDTADKDVLKTMRHLTDRLSREMYNHPDNDKLNSH